ncbi:DEAD/DEAH box helicase family protein [Crassaminicella indica]|uniref:Helicase C-terminal domain-containing protein n=1 Tax=Crassaminicella indica TaxID=2855394 RepID=A0ABX8RC51_9CLOT|nr:helicase-related protein [Crassaminicella indica]QXM06627.1 hypothetical protein KVH43_02435 [Crassaminicella indica]
MMKNEKVEKRINDEVKIVKHLHNVIKDGLLGRNEIEVIGEEPTRRFFSGVLFSDSEFNNDINEENKVDFQIQRVNLFKNVNLGLEFLVEPMEEKISGYLSFSFNLYPRYFPSYEEQRKTLEYLNKEEDIELNSDEFNMMDSENNISNIKKDKGLMLLEKYRQVKIEVEDYYFEINTKNLKKESFLLKDIIIDQFKSKVDMKDFFSIKESFINARGFVPIYEVPNSEDEFNKMISNIKDENFNIPEWNAEIVIDPITYKDRSGKTLFKIVVSLINKTPKVDISGKEKPTGHPLEFFDCNLSVKVDKNIHRYFEFDGAPKDYKYDKKYKVKGINCVGISEEIKNHIILSTETVPSYFQNHYRTREDLAVKFDDLADKQNTIKVLKQIALEMKKYSSNWQAFINNNGDKEQQLNTKEEVESCIKDMEAFEKEIESFELGIYTLERDDRLMLAFNIMNKIFSEASKYSSWRLFQIVFVVRILPSLLVRELPEKDILSKEIKESASYADVLWFPTGGGKTEAYFGLIICALFYDRLRGKKRGCTAWIRFPLRMLSKNQLDRLAKILIYAEKYRQTSNELLEKGDPFSIGFFAGGSNTDNFVNKRKVTEYMRNEINKKKRMMIHKCPMCNKDLTLEFDNDYWKFMHVCTNKDCFVYKSSLKGKLPLYMTDSEVYRFVPSVLCGTVDKLAILGRYREFSHIFGQVGGFCKKHGYFSDRCIVGTYDEYGACDAKAKETKLYKAQLEEHKKNVFYDPIPSLLIQDELHLLKEELGVLNGHYEGMLNECSRLFGREKFHLPKIIAATATIEAYEKHVKHLYLRRARKYPSMGFKNGESFYATSKPIIKRRLYMGVLSHARSQDEVIGRCLYLYHKEILRLYSQAKNSWKKICLESIKDEKEFFEFISNYDLSVVYVNKKAMGHDVKRRLDESVYLDLKKNINLDFDMHTEILTGDNEMDKIVKVIDKIEADGSYMKYKNKLHTLIATSLISHGVDLERINAFFMAGMPSKYAEYIQASSRSSRSHTGLVLVSFRANDLRERSQYEFFIQNHIFLDRLVDPVPINRFAIKAIERSISGLLAGLLYCVHSQRHKYTLYNCGQYQKYIADQNTKGNRIEDELLESLKRIIGVDSDLFSIVAREKAEKAIEKAFQDKIYILNKQPSTMKIKDENVLNPITSFRDIEEGLTLQSNFETDYILRFAFDEFNKKEGSE